MAGDRRADRPGQNKALVRLIAFAAILVGLILVVLHLLPGFHSRAAVRRDASRASVYPSTPTPTDRGVRPTAAPSPTVSLEPLPFEAKNLDLDVEGWYGWSVLDRRTGEIIGSKSMAETSTTASMIKSWIVADYLRRTAGAGQTPSDATLADATQIIRDSDNTLAQQFYSALGGATSIKRLLSTCELTDSSVARDGSWSSTRLSPRDTARLGACIADGRAAGPKWTRWLINEMRLVRGEGDFGIRNAFPAAERKSIAIKNGWIDRSDEREIHISCLAIGDTWTMGVMVRYPIDMGYEYGMDECQKITEALLRSDAF
ncbi:hypothetical protein [Micromonospora sp. NPDC006431]|uniref:hypothetical protein n=1 Tax=Micromonospora sp. NPDC006431 TaxID=3364235 RepID=UPI0036764E63